MLTAFRELLCQRRVVVDYFPSVGKFAEYQGEDSVRRLAVGHGQVPCTADEGGLRSKHLDPQV